MQHFCSLMVILGTIVEILGMVLIIAFFQIDVQNKNLIKTGK